MEVTRTSLSSYQGNNKSMPKQVRYAGAATKGKYGEELRENLSTLGQIRGKAPVIKADAVEAAVSDPNEYTKDECIQMYLKKNNNFSIEVNENNVTILEDQFLTNFKLCPTNSNIDFHRVRFS